MSPPPRVSVVIATYGRPEKLLRLMERLADQTLPSRDYEVVVVDDGSPEPMAPHLEKLTTPFALHALVQANAGPASARHRGIEVARGDLLVIIDDDMHIEPGFLEAHADHHPEGTRNVVLGPILPKDQPSGLPLLERYNHQRLRRWSSEMAAGRATLLGTNVCTGNVSLRRADYLAVGGFDPVLPLSEDAELGLRLEAAGAALVWAENAAVLHDSAHPDERWMARARRYGSIDLRIGRKHADKAHADPWRYLFMLSSAARPLLAASALLPGVAGPASSVALAAARLADRAGQEGPALRLAGLAYAIEYFRGIGLEAGTPAAALRSAADYLEKIAGESGAPSGFGLAAVRALGRMLDR